MKEFHLIHVERNRKSPLDGQDNNCCRQDPRTDSKFGESKTFRK